MDYGDFKYLPRRTASEKVLRDKTFNIVKKTKYDAYQRVLSSMVYNYFDKISAGANTSVGAIKISFMSSQQLVMELYKPVIRKFKERKVYLSFKDNIMDADLSHMQLISIGF